METSFQEYQWIAIIPKNRTGVFPSLRFLDSTKSSEVIYNPEYEGDVTYLMYMKIKN